jgi:replicative DNA helicase
MSQEFVERGAGRLRVGELLSLETSVLNVLCLTVNTAGSELKYRILDSLSEEDFYFPINKAIFNVLTEMHQRGDFVVLGNLEEELRRRSESLPEGFFLDDLFRGELPTPAKLDQWLVQVRERSAAGASPVPDAIVAPRGVPAAKPELDARPRAARPVPAGGPSTSTPSASITQVRAAEARQASSAPPPQPSSRRGTPSAPALSSESEDWHSYLAHLAAKQGKTFETGFVGLDESLGGLSPGLMLVLDNDGDRLRAFLKQLSDQIAQHAGLPCLYLSFELPKHTLRIRTLARLAGVPAQDIEKGRLKKDSREWQRVEECGRAAADWMKRLFVSESDPGTGAGQVRDLCQRLLSSTGASSCMVVVDSLERLGMGGESLRSAVSELKKLAEALDVLVVAATSSSSLLADRSVDLTAALHEGGGGSVVEVELLRASEAQSLTLRFDYQASFYRFAELR